jgi:hypothetical protein
MIQTSAVCSRSNSLTWISPVRPDRRGQRRRLLGPDRRRAAPFQAEGLEAPARDGLDPRVDDQRQAVADRRARLEEAERIPGPDLERIDPEVATAPQRHLGDPRALTVRAQRDGAAGERHGQRGWIVDLQPELRDPARAAQGVGGPEHLTDVRLELVHGVPGLEVGEAEARHEVAPAQHSEPEVDQEEEEGGARAEGRHDEGRRDDQEWQAAEQDHGTPSARRDRRA